MTDIIDTDLPDEDGDRDGTGNGNGRKKSARVNPDYDVGYGRPPIKSRWPKGQSGNPRGPKKGSRGLKKDLHKALNATHTIQVDGRKMKGTHQELAMFTLAKRAGTGDLRAIRELVELTLKIFGPEDRGRDRQTLSSQDQELLDRLLERMDNDDEPDAGEVEGISDEQLPEAGEDAGGKSDDDDDGEEGDEA